MKKYYLHSGTAQDGPFSIDDLKTKQITADTMVWYEGLTEWKKAGEIPELQTILQVPPPPFTSKNPPPFNTAENTQTAKPNTIENNYSRQKLVKTIGWSAIIIILILAVWSLFYILPPIIKNSPVKILVNPPKPRIVESHANEDPSSTIFHFHEGVYATVLNEGGGGKLLIKATLKQGANTYVKTDFVVIGENETKEFHFDFTEPSRYDEQMTFDVIATAMQ